MTPRAALNCNSKLPTYICTILSASALKLFQLYCVRFLWQL